MWCLHNNVNVVYRCASRTRLSNHTASTGPTPGASSISFLTSSTLHRPSGWVSTLEHNQQPHHSHAVIIWELSGTYSSHSPTSPPGNICNSSSSFAGSFLPPSSYPISALPSEQAMWICDCLSQANCTGQKKRV